jgi:multiple sugar transport system ATP-binding protein
VALPGGESLTVVADEAKRSAGNEVTLGIRPEHVLLADTGLPVTGLPITVSLVEQLGGNTVLDGTLSTQQSIVVQVVGQSTIRRGDTVHVQLPQAACHAFDAHGLSLRAG